MSTLNDLEKPRPETPAADAPSEQGLRARLPHPRTVGRAAGELALVAVLFGAYKLGRAVVAGQEDLALRHAGLVHQAESALRLPSEAALQGLVGSPDALRMANVYYTTVHFPLMALFLVWGLARRPAAEYRWARNLLVVMTGVALAVHMAFPLAPPRMFPQWGFADTMTVLGPSPYDGASGAFANQFAAMPSLHVGWAVLIAYVVARTGPRWLAVLAVAHALVTTVVVVITANHWWLDAAVGALLLVLADAAVRRTGDVRLWDARRR